MPTRSRRSRRVYCPPPSALVLNPVVRGNPADESGRAASPQTPHRGAFERDSSPNVCERCWVSSFWLAGGGVPDSSTKKRVGGSKREVSKGAIGKMRRWQQRSVQTVVGP